MNSFKVSFSVMAICLLLGVPFSYFFTFYELKGRRVLFVLALLCTMSAPFIGAYSWIMLLGRNGVITKFVKTAFGIKLGSIYGFNGILLVQSLKLFPLVMIYMNGAFQDGIRFSAETRAETDGGLTVAGDTVKVKDATCTVICLQAGTDAKGALPTEEMTFPSCADFDELYSLNDELKRYGELFKNPTVNAEYRYFMKNIQICGARMILIYQKVVMAFQIFLTKQSMNLTGC